ncbi:hypothetical protein FBUS_05764 [Fasciolopsis buskii]|uniref:Uncharacterized protein n=1 Tax=Fasciolopsis buskii TaxID=27845 RepID=A0A8E0VIY1_9TREM|nr:hypothetical protein FBUS_05764 [Fasciolopsis buski]
MATYRKECCLSARLYYEVLLIIGSYFAVSVHSDWTISARLNPNCTSRCERYNLIYVKARNQTTSVHAFFDSSQSSPSLLLAQSSNPDAEPTLNWITLFNSTRASQSILVPNVTQSYALMLPFVS